MHRRCYVGLAATVTIALSSFAQVWADPPKLVEPGPVVTGTRNADGSTEQIQTYSITRPMCGPGENAMSQVVFTNMVRQARAAAEFFPRIEMDESPTPRAGLTINYTLLGGAPNGAAAAITAGKAVFEKAFKDPITVNIDVTFQNLGQGSGVLGFTQSEYAPTTYDALRAGLIAGKDADDTVQDFLPTGGVPVRFAGAASTATNVTQISATRANYKAAIGNLAGSTQKDAAMTFNTGFDFDYDPSDGVPAGKTCFRSVLVHETLHALGFVSEADSPSTNPRPINPLDIFRFQRSAFNPSNLSQIATFPRIVTFDSPNDDQNTDLGTVEYRMSDGNPWQASHFRDEGGVFATAIGIMQPALADGNTFAPDYFKQADLDAMDAIGYDHTGAVGSGDCATCNVTFKSNTNTENKFPPFPTIAAGPQTVITSVDQNFAIYDKLGNSIFTVTYDAFFNAVRSSTVQFNIIKYPRVLYDQYLQKYLVAAVGQAQTQTGLGNTFLLIAVSSTSNPRGDQAGAAGQEWFKYAIPTSTNDNYSDFMSIGIDESSVIVTFNMLSKASNAFANSLQLILDKAPLSGTVTIPPTQLNQKTFFVNAFSMIPAVSFGTTKTQWYAYFDQGLGSALGTIHLVFRGNKLTPGDTSAFTADKSISVPSFENADPARQKQTGINSPAVLDSQSDRLGGVVVRGDSLWAVHTVKGANGSILRWYEFDISGFPFQDPIVKQSGDVDLGPSGIGGAIDNFNPNIMVTAAGDMLLAFSSAGPNNYVSMAYTWRSKTDTAGATRVPEVIKAGSKTYIGTNLGLERWGAYSGLALDPSDQATLWAINEIASLSGNWEIWTGSTTLTLTGGGGGGLPSPSALQISAPNGGENLVTQTTRKITWSFSGTNDAPVALFLYKGSTLLGKIADNLNADAGATGYDWNVGTLTNGVPISGGTDYRVRVSSVNDPTIFDESDQFFRITEKVKVKAGVFDQASVLQPSVVFGPNDSVSLTGIASLGQAPYVYEWAPQDFLDNPSSPTPVARPNHSMQYTLTVRDATGNSTAAVVDLTMGNPLKVSAGADLLYPAGGTATLEGSVSGGTPPYTIQWFACDPTQGGCTTPVATTIQPTVTPGGNATYFLRVIDATNTVRIDSMSVEPGFNITLEIEPGNGGSILRSPIKSLYKAGETVTLTPQPAAGFTFKNWASGANGTTSPLTIAFPAQSITVRGVFQVAGNGNGNGNTGNPNPSPIPGITCFPSGFSTLSITLVGMMFVRLTWRRRRR